MKGTGYGDRLLNQKPGWRWRHDDNGNGGQKNKEEEVVVVVMTNDNVAHSENSLPPFTQNNNDYNSHDSHIIITSLLKKWFLFCR